MSPLSATAHKTIVNNFETCIHVFDTVLCNYFCTEIIGGAFCVVCTTNLNIDGAFTPPATLQSVHLFRVLLHCPGHANLRAKFYGNRPRGTPPSGLNARNVAKYSDARHVEGYISVIEQDTALCTVSD